MALDTPLTIEKIAELFEDTLKGAVHDDAPWEAIYVLRHNGTPTKELHIAALTYLKKYEGSNSAGWEWDLPSPVRAPWKVGAWHS